MTSTSTIQNYFYPIYKTPPTSGVLEDDISKEKTINQQSKILGSTESAQEKTLTNRVTISSFATNCALCFAQITSSICQTWTDLTIQSAEWKAGEEIGGPGGAFLKADSGGLLGVVCPNVMDEQSAAVLNANESMFDSLKQFVNEIAHLIHSFIELIKSCFCFGKSSINEAIHQTSESLANQASSCVTVLKSGGHIIEPIITSAGNTFLAASGSAVENSGELLINGVVATAQFAGLFFGSLLGALADFSS